MSFPYVSKILFLPYQGNPPLDPAEQDKVKEAFNLMYNNSPEAKNLLDGFFSSSQHPSLSSTL